MVCLPYVAVATVLAYGNDQVDFIFEQNKMRDHVLGNLGSGSLQPFPRLAQSTNSYIDILDLEREACVYWHENFNMLLLINQV